MPTKDDKHMSWKRLTGWIILAFWGCVLAQETTPAFKEVFADKALLAQVRQGGYVLYMRHGTTDNSRADRAPHVDLNDCSTQRVLNDEGRKLAVALGKSIRQARIPVGEIFHSPLCRAAETTQLAFGGQGIHTVAENHLMYTANLTTEEKQPVLQATRRLLSNPVPTGTNRVVVAHAPNMADLIGYFIKPEGTIAVILPEGEQGFRYIASIPPALWGALLK